jgi:hypothetical protein
MNYLFRNILMISLITIIATGNVFAQKSKKKTTRIGVEYFKNNLKTESLVATLRIKEGRYVPLSNILVHFYCINDTAKVMLDKIRTDEKGEAIFLIEDNPKIFKDSLGYMSFEIEYPGNITNKGVAKKITVKQANLEISFYQKDTVKYIEVNANEIGPDNQFTPVKDLNILLYVKGTFSLLNFGKEKTDENGKIMIEFPVDMPGDVLGVLTIVIKIEDDDTYGTIESRGEINWGIPVKLAEEKQRGLGDTDAPLWMVYTLIILLSTVWFHYLYVIFMILKVKLAKRSF